MSQTTERKVFNTSDRIQELLKINTGRKGSMTEFIKALGLNHKSQYYTRMKSNSWSFDEIMSACEFWEISLHEFAGIKERQPHHLFIEQRIDAIEKQLRELTK